MDFLVKLAADNFTFVVGAFITAAVLVPYLVRSKRMSRETATHLGEAKKFGLSEPVTIHPLVNKDICIGSGACITACPEHEILGRVNNLAEVVYASRCVGHGACAKACPVGAIELVFGTAKRGVDLPQVFPNFESNVKRLFIAGELGGMGLIRNAILQGKEAMDYIGKERKLLGFKYEPNLFDVVIVGSGPAGLSAALQAKSLKMNFLLIDQEESPGGAILSYPRAKVVMTRPAEIPMYGRIGPGQLSKEELLEVWKNVIKKTGLEVSTGEKALSIEDEGSNFTLKTSKRNLRTRFVMLANGRRGTPRKLGVPGESHPKVMYRLLEPENFAGQKVLVVGGGDSAIEASVALSCQEGTTVTLSYRGSGFFRIKPDNQRRIQNASASHKIALLMESTVRQIKPQSVEIDHKGKLIELANDSVFVFAGGELPNEFLTACGIKMDTLYGDSINRPRDVRQKKAD